MHHFIALLRLFHRELVELGPGIVPAVLSKYRTECGWAIALLCSATALFDLVRRRWLGGLLWLAAGTVLFAGFKSSSWLWSSSRTVALGWTAIALAVGAVLEALVQEVRLSLAASRRERRALRRIQPGVASMPRRY